MITVIPTDIIYIWDDTGSYVERIEMILPENNPIGFEEYEEVSIVIKEYGDVDTEEHH
jgi:hypothetical protein